MSDDSVLVIGGGIAGMQASIDLANMGLQVYLVESSPSIGGRMAQLDKTFPTNDCAMCILAPKMMECYRHENVRVLSYSAVVDVKGELGKFQVKVLRKPRYIDETKCTGCGECAQACPVEVSSEFDQGRGKRKAIYKPFAQAVPNWYVIDKKGISPCMDGCPAHVRGQGYVALISQGKFKEALNVVRETLPFPSICGRACHHPCEERCNRKDVDGPVSLRALKRFIADWARENGEEPPELIKPTREEKAAIIGAGPSGLTCALRLLEKGYPVTIFEASDKPGGMVAGCIPDYRLPKEIQNHDIARLLGHGIELRTSVKVGRDVSLKELAREYKAIYVAVGAQEAAGLALEGADLKGVIYGLPFLRDVKAGVKVEDLGQKIVVVGGGNVAIDCARSALRVGAKEVHLVCLERRDLASRDRMPAHEWEIEEAEEEGVIIHGSLGPSRMLGKEGRVAALETEACTSVYEADGRFAPNFSGEAGPSIEGDTVIIAVGQKTDLSGFEDIEQTPRRTIKVDEITLETNLPGVFAGGDTVSGPASIVAAVAHGNEAAISMDRFLNGLDLKEGRAREVQVAPLPERAIGRKERLEAPKRDPQERVKGFEEIELVLTEEAAIEEARRCLNCAVCSWCRECERVCQAQAVRHEMKEQFLDLTVKAILVTTGLDLYDVTRLREYGYGKIQNVITAMEYERLTSASGPTAGNLERPSDKKVPSTIAFIQCVGSRDFRNKPYCSSVCCMHATKEAIMAYEHHPGTKSYILYMDLRAVGKRFQEYVSRAREEYQVTYIRSRPGKIEVNAETQNPVVWYEDTTTGETKSLETELVVLAQAMIPSQGLTKLASVLGIDVDEQGFVDIPDRLSHPLDASKPGIFVCGYAHSPRDIPDSVVQASAAAGRVAEVMAGAK
jgi:heterodisulfide reductase subunit A-like polyferredoxin